MKTHMQTTKTKPLWNCFFLTFMLGLSPLLDNSFLVGHCDGSFFYPEPLRA